MSSWAVKPSLTCRFFREFELFAGARYNNLNGESWGPFGRNPTGTQDWWDPIVGANMSLPLGKRFMFNMRGDIGGFEVGSSLTWQAFPSLSWQISRAFSMQAGYRRVYTDYETGSGLSRFEYGILSQGPQRGFTLSF